MSYCKVCGKKLELTPEYDMCIECQGKQHKTFTIPNNRGSVSNKTEMSKELEALYKLSQIEFETGDYMNDDGYMMKIVSTEMYDILLKALTPPTADEVCKALSEYLERNVKIDIDNTFYYSDKNGLGEYDEIICGYGWEHEHHTIAFEIDLPPHLITLIGRFYEGVEKVGKEE